MLRFSCKGHENVLCTHKNTIEFTKDNFLTPRGDCILGIDADFDHEILLDFIKNNENEKIVCKIECDNISDSFTFFLNPHFCDKEEIVIRKSDFCSNRTFGIGAQKAAKDIKRELVDIIQSGKIFYVIFDAYCNNE